MLYTSDKRRNLPIFVSAMCAFLSTISFASDNSDDESGCCGCLWGSSRSERKRLISHQDRTVSQPPLQEVVYVDNDGGSHNSSSEPYQAPQTLSGTNGNPQGTPPRKGSESGSALPASPSIKLNERASELSLTSLQRQILPHAQAEKISQRIWDLLACEDSRFQPISDEINKSEYAEATFFDFNFRNANMCKLVITIQGQPIERRVSYNKK